MWIGSCRNDTAAPLGLTWVNTVKALGIVFTYNEIERLHENFYDTFKRYSAADTTAALQGPLAARQNYNY